MKSIVIYDDNCSACTVFGTFGHNIIPLGYSTKKAKELMKAQFGKDYGFALMIFTPNNVSWGSFAAAEITRKGYNKFIGRIFDGLIHFIYPFVVGFLNIVLNRKRLPEAPKFKNKKLPKNGKILITKNAKEKFLKIVDI